MELPPAGPPPGPPGGPNTIVASPAPDTLSGTDGQQDTFVFTLQDISGFGTPNNPANLETSSASADTLLNFNPEDGDKIRIEDEGNPVSIADIGAGFSVITPNVGEYAFIQNGTAGIVFVTSDADLSTFDANNFTDVV